MNEYDIVIHIEGGCIQSVYSFLGLIPDDHAPKVAVVDIDDLRESETQEAREAYLTQATEGMEEISFDLNPRRNELAP